MWVHSRCGLQVGVGPHGAFVGRLRDGRLPHRPASLATRLNRQLPGLDSHQQATGPPRRTLQASGSPRASSLWVSARSGSAVPVWTARRCSPATSCRSCPASTGSLPPFAMWPAFPTSDYYEGSATPRGHQPTTCLPACSGQPGALPTFTSDRWAREASSYAPAASPRVRRSPSSWPPGRPVCTGVGVDRQPTVVHCLPAHIHQIGARTPLTEPHPLFPLVRLLALLAGPGPS